MKELLLLLCRYPYDETKRETLSMLLREVKDWNETTDLINEHGIAALAAYNIKEAKLENEIPADHLAILENGQRQNFMRNLWLKERWKEADEILGNAGIKYILLKGMSLEFTLYEAKGLRQMNDTDILIKEEDSLKALNLLKDSGFTTMNLKSPLFKRIIFRLGNHLPALYRNGYTLEIHTHLDTSGASEGFNTERLFRESGERLIDDRKALILPDAIHLEYLKKHFERHANSGECQLRSYADIANLGDISKVEYPDNFVTKPFQSSDPVFRKTAYKITIRTLPVRYRILFVIGDIFPSVRWMRERYRCSAIKTFLYYPRRIGKLFWLLS